MPVLRLLAFLALLSAPAALLAQACPLPPPPGGTRAPVDLRRPDQGVLTAAVLHQLDHVRCQEGLPPLAPSRGLIEVATRHSWYMAAEQVLSHDSTVRGQTTLAERLRASGERFTTGAENVGYVGGCGRNYLELANAMVRVWVASADHRANMLKPDVRVVGAGVAYAGGCTRAYMTLDLAG